MDKLQKIVGFATQPTSQRKTPTPERLGPDAGVRLQPRSTRALFRDGGKPTLRLQQWLSGRRACHAHKVAGFRYREPISS